MQTEAIAAYEAEGNSIIDYAKSIMIVDETTRELATEFTTKARQAIKAIRAEFGPDITHAHQLHKDLLARQKKLIAPFEGAKCIVDAEIGRDFMEREKARRDAEWKAQAKVDTERRVQEAALAAEAEKLIGEGRLEDAEELVDVEVAVAPVLPTPEVRKTIQSDAGSATVRKDIVVEVADKMAVIEAVVKRELPVTLLTVDLGSAKRYAKASRLTKMPGFRITERAVVSGRAR